MVSFLRNLLFCCFKNKKIKENKLSYYGKNFNSMTIKYSSGGMLEVEELLF